VIKEGYMPASDFPFGPYPTDKLTARTENMVEYETPPHSKGLGTDTGLTPDDNPVEGAAILQNGEWPYLLNLGVRLPNEMKGLRTDIVQQFELENSPASTDGEVSEEFFRLLSSRECPTLWQALVTGVSYSGCRKELEEAKRAEAGRKRQAEEEARRLRETLGDEIEAQVSYLGLADIPASAPADVANSIRANLDTLVGYKIEALRMFVNRKDGALTIVFDCQFGNGRTTPTQMLVRLFDANGAYLTHFVTEEWFVAPRAGFDPSPHFHVHRLQQFQNSVQYSVNIRDAAYAQKAEFGWYLPQR
jgi:hypothetical protein